MAGLELGEVELPDSVRTTGVRGQLELLSAQLAALVPSAESQWDGDDRPLRDDGKVLNEMKRAAADLEDIGGPPQGVLGALGSLQQIGRVLATAAIAEAEAAGGNAAKLAEAYEELAKADAYASKEEFEKALDKLKKAFQKAREALAAAPVAGAELGGNRGRISDAVVNLQASYPTGTSADGRIEKAIDKLNEALETKRCDDDMRPSDSKGDEVLDRLKKALKELEEIKNPTAAIQASLDEIVSIAARSGSRGD